jgi:HD-like signal output (HDOD) protein
VEATLSAVLICEILERMHEEVGYQLMKSWSLPEVYCSIAANHHSVDFDANDTLLAIVRLSDMACNKVGKSLHPAPALSLVSSSEALLLRANEMSLAELEIFVEDVGELDT